MKGARARRGFTLVEALVTLVLAGIVTAGVTLALRTGLDASQRLRERSDAHTEARGVLEILSADLGAAFLSGANTEQTLFVARAPEEVEPGEPFLSFTTLNYRDARGVGGGGGPERSDAVRVDYSLQPGEDGESSVLLRREQWLTEDGPGETDVLCERVASLRLGFDTLSQGGAAGLEESGGKPTWSADISTNPRLSVKLDEEAGSPAARTLPRTVEVTLMLAPPPGSPPERLPRMYRTLVPLRASGVAPFETEILLQRKEQETSGEENGGRENGARGDRGVRGGR